MWSTFYYFGGVNVDSAQKYPNVLSLCTGAGGIEIGLSRVFGRVSTLAHVEIEAFAITNLVNKMETGQMDPVPIWTDVKTFRSRIFRGCVDILTAGYPCQPFSAAGKGEGEKDPRHLWSYVRKAIFGCRPEQVFLENVENHINIGIEKVLQDLERMGYKPEVGIFSAEECGAPQRRRRVVILANRIGPKWRQISTAANEQNRNDVGWKKKASGFGKCGELGNSSCDNERRVLFSAMHRERFPPRGSSGHVSNACDKGLQISEPEAIQREGRWEAGRTAPQLYCSSWPARPGENQYCWEEPRTIPNSNSGECKTGSESTRWKERSNSCRRYEQSELVNSGGEKRQRLSQSERRFEDRKTGESGWQWTAKPRLGRTVAGVGHRVDRLRLLGNLVVPATAERAYILLTLKHLTNNE